MFEAAELGRKVSKKAFAKAEPEVHTTHEQTSPWSRLHLLATQTCESKHWPHDAC
jgi:hypothetical protein